ncbi:MAG: divalent-cation tolerance protein CutA [Candidatus Aminicenantes bacterium]|nr:divalent-cation tolerance protein CutA [Candidatus Aminicenantes bacterium]
MEELIIVLTTFPDEPKAKAAARALLEAKLAACCTLLPGTSFYWWEDRINEEAEVVMMIKTRSSLYTDLEKKLREIHPYEVPEIIALPIIKGSQNYLDWINEVTKD